MIIKQGLDVMFLYLSVLGKNYFQRNSEENIKSKGNQEEREDVKAKVHQFFFSFKICM